MKIAIVGASGLVGREILKVIEEHGIAYDELILAASASSAGQSMEAGGKTLALHSIEEALALKPELAIFSAGGEVSRQYAPVFAEQGCYVIDNSSTWRLLDEVPLVVPEINADTITQQTRIIANPNCSTIQMVLALWPVHRNYGLKRVVVSTYQSVSGSGKKGIQQLMDEREGKSGERVYPHRIDMNLLPHGGKFYKNGYSSEEMKLVNETRKILDAPDISIAPTVVRVPVTGGHSESICVTTEKAFNMKDLRRLIKNTPGIELHDEPAFNIYPMPYHARGKDKVFVGRLREDLSQANSFSMWVVADNLRKGAATNAVQIAEWMLEKGLL